MAGRGTPTAVATLRSRGDGSLAVPCTCSRHAPFIGDGKGADELSGSMLHGHMARSDARSPPRRLRGIAEDPRRVPSLAAGSRMPWSFRYQPPAGPSRPTFLLPGKRGGSKM